MRTATRLAFVLSLLPLSLVGGAALGDGVEVKITNDGTEDIVVTVYDMSVNPYRVVLAAERINGFTTVPISVGADATGKAKLSWTATSTDGNSRKCGHEEDLGVGDAASVNVHADSSCSV
jgi:hypothetical protein